MAKKRKKNSNSGYSVRLTSKYQATIPKEIRKQLQLEIGDEILYEPLPDNSVIIQKSLSLDLDYLEALNSTLSEWESEADEQTYKNL